MFNLSYKLTSSSLARKGEHGDAMSTPVVYDPIDAIDDLLDNDIALTQETIDCRESCGSLAAFSRVDARVLGWNSWYGINGFQHDIMELQHLNNRTGGCSIVLYPG